MRIFLILSFLITSSFSFASQPTTNDVLRIVHTWFTDANIASLGAQGCMQKVEQELRTFTPTAAATVTAAPQMSSAQSSVVVSALENRFAQQFQEVSGAVTHLMGQQATQLNNIGTQSNASQLQQLQETMTRDQALIRAGNDALQGLSLIACAFGKPKIAQQAAFTGQFALKFVENSLMINAIPAQVAAGTMTSAAGTMAAAAGWVGIAVGVVGMISSTLGGGDDGAATEAMFQAIAQLSKQMHQYHIATMQAIEGIHEHLHAQDRFMLENFFELRTGQQDIKDHLTKMSRVAHRMNYAMRGNVAYVADLLQNHHRFITGDLASLRVEGILDLVEESNQVARAQHIPTASFKEYATRLFIKGSSRAKGPYVTGGALDVTSPHDITSALVPYDVRTNLWAHPAFANVNLIRGHSIRFQLLPQELGTNPDGIVNPLIWLTCTEALATLVSKKLTDPLYPEDQHTKQLDLELIEKMEHEGTRYVDFVRGYGHQGMIDYFGNCYGASIDEFTQQVQNEVATHEQQRSVELRTELARKSAEEIARFQMAAAKCPTAVKLVDEAFGMLKNKAGYLRYQKEQYYWVRILPRFLLDGRKKEALIEAWQIYLGKTKALPMHYDAFVAQEKKNHGEMMQQKANALMPLCGVSVSSDATAAAGTAANYNSVSKVAYPQEGCGYTALLPLPYGKDMVELFMPYKTGEQYERLIEKIKQYALLEQQGIGTLYFEYQPHASHIYLRTFFNFKNGVQKQILTLKYKVEEDSLYTYETQEKRDEALQLWWYGGRYPKAAHDKVQFPRTRSFEAHKMIDQVCYYPPTEGYDAAKDHFMLRAVDETVADAISADAQTALVQAKERVLCNNKVKANLQPSTNSKLFTKLRLMDMCHKLLDACLVLVHNENMFANSKLRAEFDTFYSTGNEHVYDARSTLQYVEGYSAPESTAALAPYALPQLLQRTKQAKLQALQGIKQLNLAPQCARVSSAVSRLAQLRQVYTTRVTPVPRAGAPAATPTASAASAAAPAQTAAATRQDIVTLQADNRRLTDMVNGLQQQMAAMLALLQQQANNR